MFCRKLLLIFLVLVSASGFAFSRVPSQTLEITSEPIGVRTFKYKDKSRSRPVTVELWYPTDHLGSFDEPEDVIWIHPKETRNVPLREGIYPLIVMSHGHRGDRRDRSWLADHLVRHGYVVASVEHFGNTRGNYNPLISFRFWERPRDVSFALSQILKEPFLKEKIDPNRIGFAGYSLGGMTGLALAGAVAKNVKETLFKYRDNLEEFDERLLGKIDFKEAEQSYAEPRIRAFLLICPAIFIYPPETLSKIQAPIGLVAAINDEVLPHKYHAYQIIKHLVPTKLKVMRKEISHYSFLNPVSAKGKKLLKKSYSKDPPCCDRKSIHSEVGAFAISFFDEVFQESQKAEGRVQN